jgi:hypothetical protein
LFIMRLGGAPGLALAVGLCALSAACAGGGAPDEADAAGGGPDALVNDGPIDAMPLPDVNLTDAPPKKGFGEPCTGKPECESNICVFNGLGGVCSQVCNPPDCPTGYGCFSVLGGIDPGVVSEICVPLNDQLCSPCTDSTECGGAAQNLCVTDPDGLKSCAQDCSAVSCPTGYDCSTVNIGGTDYKQCLPHSLHCDCNTAAMMGLQKGCVINTPLGTMCNGTETCGGTAGWGACAPPSATDDPDGTYTDDNCDGIDGDITKGIFVAGGGANTGTCGLTTSTPCQTISFGIIRAVQAGKQNVYVQSGTYNEVVVLLNGINVWGGYDFGWQRGPYSDPAHRVTIVGAQDTGTGGDGEFMAVRAHDLIVGVTMGDLIIQGPNATGTGGNSGLDGRSSYGVHAKAATLNLVRVQIQAGNGAPGGTGASGADAVIVDAQSYMVGGQGGNGDEFNTACDSSSRGSGGGGASNTCTSSPSTRSMNGGPGGPGGTMDTDCGLFSLDLTARAGSNGQNANFVTGTFGRGGSGGSGGDACGPTTPGNPGVVINGSGGTAGAGGYLVGSGYWYAHAGNGGGTGENGSGGGGGGGAGGCDVGTDSYGAGGGGGGAGGCAARGGGGGGGGGGGSFGVFAVSNSTVNMTNVDLVRGLAGKGGDGGIGGRGQSGGAGGPIGAFPGGAMPGVGGAGAHGGHGGGGGGGQGGRSVGVAWTAGSSISGAPNPTGGAAGTGGNGGQSAPTAPILERDGSNGQAGAAGTLEATHQCNSPSDC